MLLGCMYLIKIKIKKLQFGSLVVTAFYYGDVRSAGFYALALMELEASSLNTRNVG